MSARNVYLETTTKSGEVTITDHQTWDADRFIQARIAEGASGKGVKKAVVREMSEAEWRDWKWKDSPGRAAARKEAEANAKKRRKQ